MVENASKAELVIPLIPRMDDCLVVVTSRPNLSLDMQLPGVINKVSVGHWGDPHK